MKKTISLLAALMICLSLFACSAEKAEQNIESPKEEITESTGQSPKTATVITNEAKTVEVNAQDLFDEYDSNEARFEKIYGGATINFVGTIKNIKTDTKVVTDNAKVSSGQNKIVFEEGWSLIISSKNTTYDLADFYPGQKLKVSTGIINPAFDTEFLQKTADGTRTVWLVGNDLFYSAYDMVNNQTTTIEVIA